MVSSNVLIPKYLGASKTGGHPQTPSRKYPAHLFQHSLILTGQLEYPIL